MTKEDKAKRYDEALDNAKVIHKTIRKDLKPIIEQLFPELKESEGEQIRQRIIHALHGDVLEMSEIKEAIAWLERQGTPAKLSEEEQNRFAKGVLSSCALSFIDYLDAHKYEGKMCVSNGECEDIENAFHNAMWDRLHRYYCKYIEKQGEKKPLKVDFHDLLMDVKFGIDPSPKQGEKNTAWSEEDEKILSDIIKDLVHPWNEYIPDRIEDEIKWLKNRLKSIRPQSTWKPSDEHIHGLIWVINRMPDIKNANEAEAVLRDLLEQLNKLRKG